jgi:3',5'-cyclic AMP phosphodiesterase CpdA
MPVEQLVLGRDTNDAGRTAVAREVLGQRCDAIVHLGDLVGTVGSARDWARFDRDYPAQVLSAERLLVCRGNHDCGGLFMGKPNQFRLRYPESIARLRVIDLAFLRLVLLDTNVAALGRVQWEQQRADFSRALSVADGDASVRHVLVCGHHPPFTNGRWHRSSRIVHDTFMEPFVACAKARAFFSGHVHGYERFFFHDRIFIVSGGGGGARVPHLHGARQRHPTLVDVGDPHPLHFLQVDATRLRVRIVARCWHEESGNWGELDSCQLDAD